MTDETLRNLYGFTVKDKRGSCISYWLNFVARNVIFNVQNKQSHDIIEVF